MKTMKSYLWAVIGEQFLVNSLTMLHFNFEAINLHRDPCRRALRGMRGGRDVTPAEEHCGARGKD
jgi:hypothetical protein